MWIAHLDADCYYVSAERVRNLALCGCAVGVLGNNGAAVIAKSYELRASGVRTGEPIWEAKVKCPHGIFIKRDFRWYEAISKKLLELLKTISPRVEYYSIDEMFFQADQLCQEFRTNDLVSAVRQLQRQVMEQIGIPVSIGVAPSKILAKLCSDAAKPYGIRVLENSEREAFLKSQPVAEVCGIGRRLMSRLASYGIHTCWEFTQARRQWINRLLTVTGERLWWELRGESVLPLQTNRPQHKFMARGGSVGRSITTLSGTKGWMMRSLERLIESLHAHHYVCSTLSCEMEFKGALHWSARLRLPAESADHEQLFPAATALVEQGWQRSEKLTHLHLIAGGIRRRKHRQLSLFDQPAPQVDRLKRSVNEKLGRFTLRSGATLSLPELYTDGSHDYEICDVSGKLCF